jgi:HprK-related kinase A
MRSTPLAKLGVSAIATRLRSDDGLGFEIGPFVVRVRSRLDSIARHVAEMYESHLVSTSAFADLHFSVDAPKSARSFFRKQVNFCFDDEYPFKPLPYDQARPFFEWGLNWCIATTAHQYLIIHAAVVAKGNRCAMIPGRPGAGKSTLCAALVAAGWRLLSDEMALIHMDDGQIWPVPRPVSLKNASIDIIRARSKDIHIGPSFIDTHKGTVAHLRPPLESAEAMHVPARAAWVVFPHYEAGTALSTNSVGACQTTLKLADDSFNFPLLGKEGFELLSDVAFGCDAYELHYSDLDEAIAWFDNLAAKG